ncbi:MAG: ThuA domain-containing protein [Verrucomicrobia bacterium]|nr:ThuA domain-containing protein [Verrucomicrobiota bacterium]
MHLTFYSRLAVITVLFASITLSAVAAQPPKLLLVTVTTGFRHSSIPTAEKVLAQLAKDSGSFSLELVQQPPNEPQPPREPKLGKNPTDEDKSKHESALAAHATAKKEYQARDAEWRKAQVEALKKLAPSSLKAYDGVIFANTTGDLPLPDNNALLEFVRSGKAFVGMHSASDTFHGFRPFVEALGGEFLTHGPQVTVDCMNQDPNHPACQHLPAIWTLHDEIYIMKSFQRSRVHGLLGLDKHPNDKTPGDYPVAWARNVGRGRLFYTSLGHREDVWENPVYQKHILGGIQWALGQSKREISHAP